MIPQAVTFDCYGTLIDWESGARGSLAPIAARAGADLDLFVWTWLEEDRLAVERANRDGWRPYSELLVESVRNAARSLGIELAPGEDRALADSIPDWPSHSDGVAEVLADLRGLTRTAIISNTENRILRSSIATIGVPVHETYTAQDAGCYKPSAGIFRFALERLELHPSDVLHVSASIWADVEPMSALGAPVVWVNRSFETAPAGIRPDHVVYEFHALRDLLHL